MTPISAWIAWCGALGTMWERYLREMKGEK